jgi:peptide/nickel transport system permease protein
MFWVAIRKLLQGLLMVMIVSALTFTLLSSAGGDALAGVRDNPQVSEETIKSLTRVYGLDRPFAERFVLWFTSAATGDLGESFSFRIPVGSVVLPRFLNTVLIGVSALVAATMISLLLAILNTLYRNRILSAAIDALILITASTPRIVTALLALVLALYLGSPAANREGSFQFFAAVSVLALPLLSVFLAQLTDALKDAMNEDFVRLARSKGLSEWTVIGRHAIRYALNPFLTVVGLSFGGLLGGSVIVETVIGWPGIGALMVAAVKSRDIPLVMGIVLVASVAVWIGNTGAELLQAMNDPRLRTALKGERRG